MHLTRVQFECRGSLIGPTRHSDSRNVQLRVSEDMTRRRFRAQWQIGWLLLLTIFVPPVRADPIQVVYSTSGTVATAGLSGTPVFSIQGVTDGTLVTGQPFNLGQFVVDGPPSAAGTQYVNTPFYLTFTVQSINGVAPSPNDSPVTLDGWLNGKVPLNSTSEVHIFINTLNFDPEDGPPFPRNIGPFITGSYMNYLSLASGDDVYAPIQAELNMVETVPEPSAFIIFGVVAVASTYYARGRGRSSNQH